MNWYAETKKKEMHKSRYESGIQSIQIDVKLIHKGLLAHHVVAIGRRTLQMPQHLEGNAHKHENKKSMLN